MTAWLVQYPLASYAAYLLLGALLLAIFFGIYTRITPYHELPLIREGNIAAALSLSGALLGFSLPIATAISQHATLLTFGMWACVALVWQLLGFFILSRLVTNVKEEIESNNVACGILMGMAAVCLGLLNAACQIW